MTALGVAAELKGTGIAANTMWPVTLIERCGSGKARGGWLAGWSLRSQSYLPNLPLSINSRANPLAQSHPYPQRGHAKP